MRKNPRCPPVRPSASPLRHPSLLLAGATWLALGCGDGGGTGPRPDDGDGQRLGAQFERLADSVEAGGYSPAAEALRHAAEIVRLTGHATPVRVTVDGRDRSFLAVAEQIDFPNLVCRWPSDTGWVEPDDPVVSPPPDSTGVVPPDGGGGGTPGERPTAPECTVEGSYSMRTLIAWEPEQMAEVVRIVAHIGNGTVEPEVPDVMTELPAGAVDRPPNPLPPSEPSTPPDSGSGSGGEPGGWPGFMGEYLVRDVGSWFAVEGSQMNSLEGITGACTANRATFDWAEFGCEAARLRFEFSMSVEPAHYERLTGVADPPGGPEGSHELAMASSSVDGVRLTWVEWSMPPLPEPGPPPEPSGPDPIPGDSTGVTTPTE